MDDDKQPPPFNEEEQQDVVDVSLDDDHDDENPFGSNDNAEDENPFGNDDKDEENPFGSEDKDDDNPFGDSEPQPTESSTQDEEKDEVVEKPPVTDDKKDDSGDPFGGDDDDDDDDGVFDKPAPKPVKDEEPKPEPTVVQSEPKTTTKSEPKTQPAPKASSPKRSASGNASGQGVQRLDRDYVLEIEVSEPQRQGEGMSSYVVYRVSTKTDIPEFGQPEVGVMHRYSEFLNLQKHLIHEYPCVVVPPVPPKDAVGTQMMKFKSQGEEITPFIERRGHALERFLKKVALHPILHRDPLFIKFLTSEEKPPKVKSNVLSQLASKLSNYVEQDEYFADRYQEVETIEAQLKKLHLTMENYVLKRRQLAEKSTMFAESFAALAEGEEVESLKSVMLKMADVESKVARLHTKQEQRDFYEMSEIAQDYISLMHCVKIAFNQRVDAHRAHLSAVSHLNKKTELQSKYTAQNKTDKLEQAEKDVVEAKEAVDAAEKNFQEMSARLKDEIRYLHLEQVHDFKNMLVSFVESMMSLEHQVGKAWEMFLSEAKSIGQ